VYENANVRLTGQNTPNKPLEKRDLWFTAKSAVSQHADSTHILVTLATVHLSKSFTTASPPATRRNCLSQKNL